MPKPLSIAIGLLMLLGLVGFVFWAIYRSIKRSEDPAKLLFKWVLTFLIVGASLTAVFNGVGNSEGGAFIVPFVCVLIGIILSIVWAPSIGAWVSSPITSLFDGGDQEPVSQPLYSIAIAKRKMGKYQEAIVAIEQQLKKFPQDFTGQMMMAEIQAENLNDLPTAQNLVQRVCQQASHTPKNISYALNVLADWQMKFCQDSESAREFLEKIIELFPDSESAQAAAQRIAHLSSTETLLAAHDRRIIALPTGIQNIGLLADSSVLRKAEVDPAVQAAEYVKHLEQFPLDGEAREKLALLYAEHYQRPDLAAMELEQLIQQPSQPPRQIVHWLNLLADFHVKYAGDEAAARKTLQRIIDLYPALSHAQVAQQRLDYLKLEVKGKEKSQAVKLGSYEQNIGLKKR